MSTTTSNAGYEFDDNQNSLFQDLAKKMRFVGVLSLFGGALSLALGVFVIFVWSFIQKEGVPINSGINSIIQGVILLLVGRWTVTASRGFKLIVNTMGHDIDNLMNSLGELRKLYTLQYALAVFAVALITVAFLVFAIVTIASIFSGS